MNPRCVVEPGNCTTAIAWKIKTFTDAFAAVFIGDPLMPVTCEILTVSN
jgi:hypothetical protein